MPMTGVLVVTSPLDDVDSRADHGQLGETVLVAGEGLVEILSDILDFARIDAGRLRLESIDFDLRSLVDDVVDLLSVPTHHKGLELACRFPLDMPMTVRGDPARLRRTVTSLVGNALQFSPSGDALLELTVADRGEEGVLVRFEVSGSVMGVAQPAQPALFAPASPVDAGTIRSYGAAGLCLAMAHQIVELMGGEIGVHSVPGDRGGFWFTVPLQRSRSAPSVAPSTAGQILLAEDNPVNQRVASAMLENLGFRVDVVPDGAQAVQAAASNSYQAILMDGQMPVLDGYEATTEIRRQSEGSPRTPIIAVTGSAMKSDQQRCLAAGMDDYLAKPLNLNALADVLERWTSDPADPATGLDPAEPPPAVHVGLDHLHDPDRPVLDAQVVERLQRLGRDAGEDLVGQLSILFLADADLRVGVMREALARDDAAPVVRSAHTLSGASANLGATVLARLCATLAADSAVGDLGGAEMLLEAIEEELGRVRASLSSPTPASC